MKNKKIKSLAPALDKGLDVIEFLASSGLSHTLSQIAKGLHRSVSEIQRTLTSLASRGYLVRDHLGGFRLSSKLFSIAHNHPPHRDLLSVALPIMQQFSHHTEQSVHLSAPVGLDLIIVAQTESPTRARITIQNGLVLDPFTTTSGRVYLAFLPESTRAALMKSTPLPSNQKKALTESIEKIQKTKFFSSPSHYYDGVTDMAAPILSLSTQQVQAVLATTWIHPLGKKIDTTLLLNQLRKAVHAVENAWEESIIDQPSSKK